MNKLLYIVLATYVISGSAIAQTNVNLEFIHKQGTSSFAINQTSQTSLSEDYNAHRLEYYISEISLEHDNGAITEIDSLWILVDVKKPSLFPLGQFNVTNLEAIHFSIGVESGFNHLDPSKWPVGHPLAPRSPSMHWGWSAGYRFLAMEGKCGSTLNSIYEFHSLGDQYYYQQRIETAGADNNGDLKITLNGDYDRILEDIPLGTGKIEHGDFPLNVVTLQNMRDYVFTSPEGNGNSYSTVGILENRHTRNLIVYPNPSTNGVINITTESEDLSNSKISIFNSNGSIISEEQISSWNGMKSIEINRQGYFMVVISTENGDVYRSSVVVTK